MVTPTMWIPQNDPALGVDAPAIDGFVGLRGTAVVSAEADDGGYASGVRLEVSDGTFEDVIFTAVHGRGASSDFIHLAWIANSGQRFGRLDRVVLALRPSASTHSQADARRIDIVPIGSATGADGTPAGTDAGGDYSIRTDYPPHAVKTYTGESGGRWKAPGAAPAGLEARVRSWKLPRPPAPFVHEHGWSVELRVPINTVAGGNGWITLEKEFGLYFCVMRSFEPGPDARRGIVQHPWPAGGDDPRGTLSGTSREDLSIPGPSYGRAILPALDGSAVPVQGVEVRRDSAGIPRAGVRRGQDLATVVKLADADDNEFAALLCNDAAEAEADDVLVEWRSDAWGLPGADPAGWALVPATTGHNPTAAGDGVKVEGGTGAEVETTPFHWVAGADDGDGPEPRSMWLGLTAGGTGVVHQPGPGLRMALELINLGSAEIERGAVVSGKGWPKRAGRRHEVALAIHGRQAGVSSADFTRLQQTHGLAGTQVQHVFWQWFVKAFRSTGRRLEIDGTEYPVYEAAGSFGHVLAHKGVDDAPRFALEGANVTELAPGRWAVKVASTAVAKLTYRLWTEAAGEDDEWGGAEVVPEETEAAVVEDPRFPDAAAVGEGEAFARPPWDPRPYPDPIGG